MRRLFPPPSGDETLDTLDALADAYAYPEGLGGRAAWVRANMVAALDGAARHDGLSQPLSGAADMRVFGVLRALADAVVVGAETVRQEGYRPAKVRAAFAERRAALGQAPAAAVVVVSGRLDLDLTGPLVTGAAVPSLVVTGAGADPDRLAAARAAGVEVLLAGEGTLADPAEAVRQLAARGLVRLLCEGGPRLLGHFAAAGALDELCLTVAPVVCSGTAPRIMNGPPLTVPERMAPVGILEEDGFLFTRYARAGA